MGTQANVQDALPKDKWVPSVNGPRGCQEDLKMLSTYIRMFVRDEKAATAIEYGMIVGLIAVIIIGAVTTIGTELGGTFDTIAEKLGGTAPAE